MFDTTGAKRYVLRELMELMDKNEREKLKDSFKPDSKPWQDETGTHNETLHEAQETNPYEKMEHEGEKDLVNADRNSSEEDQGAGKVEEPSGDAVMELSRKRSKNKSSY